MSGSNFADGIEFEETFPEALLQAPAAEAAARTASVAWTESSAKHTLERMRIEEEEHLAEWVQDRRAEEERRLAEWVTERRTAVERSLEERTAHTDGLAERLKRMLVEWQDRFEQRLAEHQFEVQRLAEQRRISDEERMQQWRAELEQALTERFAQRQTAERAPLPDRNGEIRMSLRDRVAATTSARDLGRVIRDVVAELARTSAFALSVHHADRDEVAYRYRVASDDDLGALLRSDTLDDGPQSAAAHMDGWARGQVTMRVGSRNVTLHAAQLAIRAGDATVGVLTLRTENDAIADSILARVRDLVALCAPHLAALRDNGSFRSV